MLAINGPQCTDYAVSMQFNAIVSENDETMSKKTINLPLTNGDLAHIQIGHHHEP